MRCTPVLVLLLIAMAAPVRLLANAPADPASAPAPEDTPALRELVALAQQTALPTPLTIVCLGDSITAATAKQPVKYPEMLQHALAQKYGQQVRVLNAGRGGDNAPAAAKRLETDVLAHQPDLVFINLGINDSKLSAGSGYQRQQVPPEQFVAAYKELLTTIREKNAKAVAVGTIACVEEWTIRTTQREQGKGNWFGKPEELKRYNAAVQALAKEHAVPYVDLYEHFRAQPDMKSFFTEPDGVHCRDRGQEQIALQLMRHLVQQYPAK